MRIRELLTDAASELHAAGVDSPRLSAEVLLAAVLGQNRWELLVNDHEEPTEENVRAFRALLERRTAKEPVSYLTGTKEFYGLDFAVTPATLIPRPETERVVEYALSRCTGDGPVLFADLGTGSGNIGITLAHERPAWRGVLLEKDPAALMCAGTNARRHGCADRLLLLCSDWDHPVLRDGCLDLLVSNPPYIAREEEHLVMEDVLLYEPRSALFSPRKGLKDLETITDLARRLLKCGGLLVLEHGASQGQSVRDMLAHSSFTEIRTEKDLAGHERVTAGIHP